MTRSMSPLSIVDDAVSRSDIDWLKRIEQTIGNHDFELIAAERRIRYRARVCLALLNLSLGKLGLQFLNALENQSSCSCS